MRQQRVAAQNELSFLNQLLEKQLPEHADSTYRANVGVVAERIAGHMALGDDPAHSLFGLLVKLEGADAVIGSAFVEGLNENWPDDLIPQFSDAEKMQLERLKAVSAEEVRKGLKDLSEAWNAPGLFGSPAEEFVADESDDHPGHHVAEDLQSDEPEEPLLDGGATEIAAGDTLTVRSVGADLSYDVTEIRASAGDRITIRYDNTESEMPHNIVFVNSEADIYPVGIASIQAYQNEYIPTDEESLEKIIGYTRLARPGEVVYVTITVPPPGTYPYICTYPGHFTMMQGRLISQ
jgi:azurin